MGSVPMPAETYTLVGLGVAGVVIAWLIFSVFKKMLGLAFLAALAFAAWMVWQNPDILQQLFAVFGFR
jgi:uncharacterized membrane protein YccC